MSTAQTPSLQLPVPAEGVIRVASFNMALNRKQLGELSSDLEKGDKQAERLAKIVGLVQPDVLLAAEVDYDGGKSARLLLDRYLAREKTERSLKHLFTCESNTGISSGLDLDHNGKTSDPNDAFGFGNHPGQYAFVVYSRFPIESDKVRSFQKFLWSDMPGALKPIKGDGQPFWSDDVWPKLRLSSKNHVDVPISIHGKLLHVLASHPTPPAFDKEEDRNGCRNHDEIRLWTDYVTGGPESDYLVSDQGTKGALDKTSAFVVVGDLNADPIDGSGKSEGIRKLLASPRVNKHPAPRSQGGPETAKKQGRANLAHKADPAEDTSDFNDREPGNLRCDYVLPSSNCEVVASGVFWPTEAQLEAVDPKLLDASDHRLVWVDLKLP